MRNKNTEMIPQVDSLLGPQWMVRKKAPGRDVYERETSTLPDTGNLPTSEAVEEVSRLPLRGAPAFTEVIPNLFVKSHPDEHHFTLRGVPAFTEVILGWWRGEVQDRYTDYFTAKLVDVHGAESLAEFDLDSVREADQDRLRVGAAFTFVVTRQDHPQGRRLVTELELLEPYLWQRGDEERAARLVQEHVPSSIFDE
jgi:hypothetical protein